MNKQEFMTKLRARLIELPRRELQERLNFYSEMIDDRMEEGLSEEEAVRDIGNTDKITSDICAELTPEEKTFTPLLKREKRKLKGWEIALLAIGSPLWASLLIAAFAVALSLAVSAVAIVISLSVAAFAVIISLYAALWAVLISVWAVFAALTLTAPFATLLGILALFAGDFLPGGFMLSGALVTAGLAILMFFASQAATRGTLWLTKASFKGIAEIIKRRNKNES